MKRSDMFTTEVFELTYQNGTQYESAVVGWLLIMETGSESVEEFKIEVLSLKLIKQGDPPNQVKVKDYNISVVVDFNLLTDNELKPTSVAITDKRIVIGF